CNDMPGAGALGVQDRACAKRERKIHAISQAVGKKEFRSGESHIIRPQFENPVRIIAGGGQHVAMAMQGRFWCTAAAGGVQHKSRIPRRGDRKSTHLNSSHRTISYAVFCLKKKKKKKNKRQKYNKTTKTTHNITNQ